MPIMEDKKKEILGPGQVLVGVLVLKVHQDLLHLPLDHLFPLLSLQVLQNRLLLHQQPHHCQHRFHQDHLNQHLQQQQHHHHQVLHLHRLLAAVAVVVAAVVNPTQTVTSSKSSTTAPPPSGSLFWATLDSLPSATVGSS